MGWRIWTIYQVEFVHISCTKKNAVIVFSEYVADIFQSIVTKKDDDSPAVEVVKDGGESGLVRAKKKKTSQGVLWSMYCDVGSRIAFPLLFALFNIGYWSYFMMQLERWK